MASASVRSRMALYRGRLRQVIEQEGLPEALRRGVRFALWTDVEFLRFSIPAVDVPAPSLGIENFSFGPVKQEEHDELVRFSPLLTAEDLREGLSQGHRCFIGRTPQRILLCGWAGTGRVWLPYLGGYVEIPSDTVYYYGVHTDAGHRGQELFAYYVSRMHAYCLEQGRRYAMTFVFPEMGLPIRAYVKVTRASRVELARFRRRLGISTLRFAPITMQDAARLSHRRPRPKGDIPTLNNERAP